MEPGSSAQRQERNRTAFFDGRDEALVYEEDGVAGRCSDAVKRDSPRPFSPWQRRLTHIISHDWFDNAVVGLILVNCVLLVLEDPTREVPRWLRLSDVAFTFAFGLEMAVKLLALGLRYFKNAWNWLDTVVVVEGVWSIFYNTVPSVKSLRALRVLRPLRTVRRMPSVQHVVTSLLRAAWPLAQVLCIYFGWLTIFAVMGVLLWSGTFDYRCTASSSLEDGRDQVCGIPVSSNSENSLSGFCTSLELLDQPYTCEEGETCVDYGTSPYAGMVNFDNLLWSLLTLFTVTTLEGWSKVMMFTQRVMSEYTVWFFVFLIVSATWTIMSLMTAAMLAKFKTTRLADGLQRMQAREKSKPDGKNSARLLWQRDEEQQSHLLLWARNTRLEEEVLSEDSLLSQAIHLVIVLNVVAIAIGRSSVMDGDMSSMLPGIELATTIVFSAEACFKIFVLGAKRYFKFTWNRFDFVVVMVSVSDLVIDRLVNDSLIPSVSVIFHIKRATAALRLLNTLRVFRILRVRCIKRRVKTVVGVILKSTRNLWPVVAVMLLTSFTFTVLGMELFGAILDPNTSGYAEHPYALKTRFDTFFWSFVQVFTVIVGDGWNTVMYRTMENTTAMSAIFFVTLVVLGEAVLFNLVLAIVLEGANDEMKEKHVAQQFCDKAVKLLRSQYRRLAMQRWAAKVRAEAMLERGEILVLEKSAVEKLGLLDFPYPTVYNRGQSSSSSNRSCAAPYQRSHLGWGVQPLSNPTIGSTTECQCEARDDLQHRVGRDGSTSDPHRLVRSSGHGQEGLVCFPKGLPRDRGGCVVKVSRVNSEKRSTRHPSEGNMNWNVVGSLKEVMGENGSKGLEMSRGQCRCQNSRLHCLEDMAEIGEGHWGKRGRVISPPLAVDAAECTWKYKAGCELSERRRRGLCWVPESRGKDETSRSTKDACICLHKKRGAQSKTDGDDLTKDVTLQKRYAEEGAKDRVKEWERSARTVSSYNKTHTLQCQLENEDYVTRRTYESFERQRRLTRASNHDDPGLRDDRAEALEKLPFALYGALNDIVVEEQEGPRWWHKLDFILGFRVDRDTWNGWYVEADPVRECYQDIVSWRHFETAMFVVVLGSTILSAYDYDTVDSVIGILDTICLIAFVVEFCIRACYHSWWIGPDAVLRNPWMLLDACLVVCDIVSTVATCLREISAALAHSLRNCGTLFVVMTVLLFSYSIVGVELFGGLFYSCSDPDFSPKGYRYGEYDMDSGMWASPPCNGTWVNPATGEQETRIFEWKNYMFNFDSIYPALLSAFVVATLDGWVEIFHVAANSYKVDYQPSENNNPQAFWYFFGGVVVFGFYATKIFVGVMLEAFLSYKNVDNTGRLMSLEEKQWRDYERRLCQVSPIVAPCSCSRQPWRDSIQRLVLSDAFNNAVISVLVLNTVVLALDRFDAPNWQQSAQDIFNHGFACIYMVETCLLIIGLGPRCYFSRGSQILEFVATMASLAAFIIDISNACPSQLVVLRLVRSLRIVRVIRLAMHIPVSDGLLVACTYPARVICNAFLLLAIALYIFANIGVALFSSVEFETTTNLYQDFSTVWRAIQLLFIVATGEAWVEYASLVATSGNQPEFIVMAFFIVFVTVMQFILTNLFVMVIEETFEILNALERQELEEFLPSFQELWSKFDPEGTTKISPKNLFVFVLQLKKPLGAEGNYPVASRYTAMLKSAPDFDYTFTKVLIGLSAALFSEDGNVLRERSYRPVNLRMTMATLIVQRALKRNLMLKQGKMDVADIVLTSLEKEGIRRGQRTTAQLTSVGSLQSDIHASCSGGAGRENSSKASLAGASVENQTLLARTGLNGNPQERGTDRIGSIILPQDMGESKWLMRRFLMDLQEANIGEQEVSVVGQVGSSGDDKTCCTMEVLSSHPEETEIRSPPSREQPSGIKRGYRYFGEPEAYQAAAALNYKNTRRSEGCIDFSAMEKGTFGRSGDGDGSGGRARRRSSGVQPMPPESWTGSVRERRTSNNNGADAIDGARTDDTEGSEVTRERREKETDDTPATSLAIWLTKKRRNSRTHDENL